ncbi:MAG TPA: lanthionine synthetase LanC family protein [Gemmatimonadaceae bacterium]|jgi:lantibiotic modifying enzyme
MDRHAISRRELIGMGLGAAAGMIALPSLLSARGLTSGAPFSMRAPVNELYIAIKAGQWIRRSRTETANGVTWPMDPLQPKAIGLDLYNGIPGIIVFNLELYYATKDTSWLDDARHGANELIAQLPTLQAAGRCGLYDGLAGAVFVLEETHKATGDGTYRDAANQGLAMIQGLAQKAANGAYWTGASGTNDIISGSAGIALLLTWAANEVNSPAMRDLGLLTGRHLLDVGVHDKGGTKWPVKDGDTKYYLNFAHGTSGVAFALAKLFAMTFDRSMYSGSLQAVRYLDAVASTDGGGYKLHHHEPGGEQLYYMGWAGGPAGTSRLFSQLGEMARTEHWNGLAQQCAESVIAAGIPEKQSPGYWGVDQANGGAGIGDFFIRLQRITPEPSYLDMVKRISAAIAATAITDGDGLKWMRTDDPESTAKSSAQTGFMQGAAGIGSYFIHAADLAAGRKPAIKWPDAPTTGPCEDNGTKIRDMADIQGGPKPRC